MTTANQSAPGELAPLGGRFSIARTLGSGAFGVVYEAFDRKLGRRVALKRLLRVDAAARYRFKQEFRALAEVVHPNLVRLHELIVDDDHWWLTMELVEGVDFFTWIRGARQPSLAPTLDLEAPERNSAVAGTMDEARLRAAGRQLALAVRALHRAGKLHLDLKPSNVLVAGGRVVVLDFGLVADVEPRDQSLSDERITGTPAYMSPEQAAGQSLSTASDWYSVGLMLHEAMTGRLPFEGSPAQIMLRKQFADAPDPARLGPGLPADLCALVHELLRRNPAERPSAESIPARLGETAPSERAATAMWGERVEERRALEAAMIECRRQAVLVEIAGPRGAGKSALVQRFVDERRRRGDALVLTGRCFQQESLPHKTLDGVIDSLTRHLLSLPSEAVRALMVPDVAALARLFPVLARVNAIAQAPPVATAMDRHELRRRAFTALRELLSRLADGRPLVLVVDDLHWGDVDGVLLLCDLVRPPAAPQAVIVAIHDDAHPPPPPVLALRDQAVASGVTLRHVPVGPLSPEEAEALARRLLEGRGDPTLAPAIAREAHGSPVLLQELARHPGKGDLAAALDARVAALSPSARALIEVLSLAHRPLPLPVARAAIDQPEHDGAFDELCAAELVRVGPSDDVECAHQWLRDAARRRLDADTRALLHRRIAAALAGRPDADADDVALHLRAGNDLEEARQWVARAAQAAVDRLQFGRAADLKRLSLELALPDEVPALKRAWADALTDAGRAAEAARAYLALVDGADAMTAMRLRQRASEQLLRSGNVDEGLQVMAPVLRAVGLPSWDRPWRAIAALVTNRARLAFRGRDLDGKLRDDGDAGQSRDADERALFRADVCWSMGTGLAGIDVIRGVAFHSRHTLLALDTGDAERIARALAWEAIGAAIEHGADDRHGRRILVDAERAAERAGSIQARGFVLSARAVTAWCAGRWRQAQARADEAISAFTAAPQKVAWEIGSLNAFWRLPAMLHTGDLEALGRRARECLREAEELGDRYIATTLRTNVMPVVWMLIDKPDQARQDSAEAIRQWSTDPGWHIQHWCDFFGQGHVDLYLGEGARALERLQRGWPKIKRAHLMRIATQRLQTAQLVAHCALNAAEQEKPAARGELLVLAEKQRRRLARESGDWPAALTTHIGAGIANLRGERERAVELLREAERRFLKIDMMMMVASVRSRLGALVGGDEGGKLALQAEQFFKSQRVARPDRWIAAMIPGCAP